MMNNKIINVLMFATGAAVGSVVTWKVLKTKYEQIAQEEINSVKEVYSVRREESEVIEDNSDDEEGDTRVTKEKPSLSEYAAKLEEYKYAHEEAKKGESEQMSFDKPYVISPDEFDENGYETETLYYYTDGVLADELDNVIEDADELIGLDSLNTFGQYEDDSVFVRNDELETDYEILKDCRKYSDVAVKYLHPTED